MDRCPYCEARPAKYYYPRRIHDSLWPRCDYDGEYICRSFVEGAIEQIEDQGRLTTLSF